MSSHDPTKIHGKRRDPNNATAAQKVFKFRYRCKIEKIHTISTAQLKQFGFITTGDKAVDQAMMRELVYANYSPADMAEFYSRDIEFFLVDPKDARVIYTHLVDLLRAWERTAADPLHNEEIPVAELEKLERLAGAMYAIARPGMIKDGYSTSLQQRLQRFGNSRLQFLNNRPETSTAAVVAKVEHTMTLTDSIKRHILSKED